MCDIIVNYAGSKTKAFCNNSNTSFENYVNYAGSKTPLYHFKIKYQFENYVNYAGSKTFPILQGY